MYVRSRLVYMGPKGFLAEWRARRKARLDCRGRVDWDDGSGSLRRRTHHRMIVRVDDESLTCYCGGISGQYVPRRDAMNLLFKRETWFECQSDNEAAEVTRREWEDEYTKTQGGGRWEWTTVDDEPGTVLRDGSVLAPRRRVFIPIADQVCRCGHAREQHASDRAVGWAECGYGEYSRTNDGLDRIWARCGCRQFRVDLAEPKKIIPTPLVNLFRPVDEEWNGVKFDAVDGRYRWRFLDGVVVEMADSDVRNAITADNLRDTVMAKKAGLTVKLDPAEVNAAMAAEIKPEIMSAIRRARRDWGEV